MAQQPLVGLSLLIFETSRSHSDTDEWSVWRGDFYLLPSTTLTRDRHSCFRRDSEPHSQKTSGRRLMPYRDRHTNCVVCKAESMRYGSADLDGISVRLSHLISQKTLSVSVGKRPKVRSRLVIAGWVGVCRYYACCCKRDVELIPKSNTVDTCSARGR
jgi:hypothetical protein